MVKFLWVSVDKTGLERDRKSETDGYETGPIDGEVMHNKAVQKWRKKWDYCKEV